MPADRDLVSGLLADGLFHTCNVLWVDSFESVIKGFILDVTRTPGFSGDP